MSLRTPLSRARGLGSAKEGASHWWMQRLTAIALVPLALWFAFVVASLGGADYETVVAWLRSPAVTVLLVILIAVTFYHLQLGVQVILEDYVQSGWLKITGIVLVNFGCILLAVIGIVALLTIALGV